jgi:hypothetical protein
MADTDLERAYAPKLGEEGEPCVECGAPLASDQRYCLECGHRRGDARIPFLDVLRETYAEEARASVPPPPPPPPEPTGLSPLAVAGVAGFVAVLVGIGVLVGALAGGGGSSKPQVVAVGGTGSGALQTASVAAFQGDWPDGKSGWTVQLQTLPKASSQPAQVAAAKQQAQSKGATAVGALDSDGFASLAPGQYVVYSGVYASKKQAQSALGKLKGKFPAAKVVQVSGGGGAGVSSSGGDPNALSGNKKSATVDKSQLQRLQNLSPQEYQKQSRKLPDTTALPGKPPPKDTKPPGGGSGGTTIK